MLLLDLVFFFLYLIECPNVDILLIEWVACHQVLFIFTDFQLIGKLGQINIRIGFFGQVIDLTKHDFLAYKEHHKSLIFIFVLVVLSAMTHDHVANVFFIDLAIFNLLIFSDVNLF